MKGFFGEKITSCQRCGARILTFAKENPDQCWGCRNTHPDCELPPNPSDRPTRNQLADLWNARVDEGLCLTCGNPMVVVQ